MTISSRFDESCASFRSSRLIETAFAPYGALQCRSAPSSSRLLFRADVTSGVTRTRGKALPGDQSSSKRAMERNTMVKGWTPEADPPLAIDLFGTFSVRRDGGPLPPLRTRKGGWLLAILTLRHGRGVERTWLAGTLWPESRDSRALFYLRRELAQLR